MYGRPSHGLPLMSLVENNKEEDATATFDMPSKTLIMTVLLPESVTTTSQTNNTARHLPSGAKVSIVMLDDKPLHISTTSAVV